MTAKITKPIRTKMTTKTTTKKKGKKVVEKKTGLDRKGAVVVRAESDQIKTFGDFADNYLFPALRAHDPEKTPVMIELATSVGRGVLEGTDEEFERVMPYLARKPDNAWAFVGMEIFTDPADNVEYYGFLFDFASLKELVHGLNEEQLD